MSAGKFIGFMILFCSGLWGILAWIDTGYMVEYFLGICPPLSIGILTVYLAELIQSKSSKFLTQFFIIAFLVKIIIYGGYIILLFNFYSFSHIHFILSFSGCFITLHISEAFFFKFTIK